MAPVVGEEAPLDFERSGLAVNDLFTQSDSRFTDRDDDPEALVAALAAWKTDDLSGVAIALTAIRDDGDEDDLEGGLDADLLFAGIGDRLNE